MTKGHLSPSWRGFVVQHEFYQGWIDTGGWGAKREGLCPTLSPLPPIRVVWVTGDTRRGGDRPCIAPLPSISTSPRFHSPFSNTFFHQIHFVGNKNARCGWGHVKGAVGQESMGTAAAAGRRGKGGGQRGSTYRERNSVKSSKFLFILAQQCLQHGLACLLLLNKYCDSSNPSEQGRNQNLDFHWGQTVMGTL